MVIDDSTLDKPYARHIELVTRHWSGKHKSVVMGINLITLLWTDGNAALPCDCRLYGEQTKDNGKPKTKNESFHEMLIAAKSRGFEPEIVCFDSWYSGIDNLKLIRAQQWHFLTRMKSNRQVNPDNVSNVAVETLFPLEEGQIVHLKEFGFVRLFRTVAPTTVAVLGECSNGDGEVVRTERLHWITNHLEMSQEERQEWERQSFKLNFIIAESSSAVQ